MPPIPITLSVCVALNNICSGTYITMVSLCSLGMFVPHLCYMPSTSAFSMPLLLYAQLYKVVFALSDDLQPAIAARPYVSTDISYICPSIASTTLPLVHIRAQEEGNQT